MRQMLITLTVCFALSGCSGNPLDSFLKTTDVETADGRASLAAVDAAAQEAGGEVSADDRVAGQGFFGGLMSRAAGVFAGDGVSQAQVVETAAPAAGDIVEQAAQVPEVPAPAKAGFFGRLFNGFTGSGDVVQASARVPAVPGQGEEAAQQDSVSATDELAFLSVGRNCEISGKALGTLVGEEAGYKLFDTIPNATVLRNHFVTGFDDGCARQFRAATAVMSDIGTHEIVRYLSSNVDLPYNATDDAYERIKASYCGAKHGKPCGARIDRLARRTTFVTIYETFGTTPTWANLLLNNGKLVAVAER